MLIKYRPLAISSAALPATYRVSGSIRSSTFSKASCSLRFLSATPFQRPVLRCGFCLQIRLFEGPFFAAAYVRIFAAASARRCTFSKARSSLRLPSAAPRLRRPRFAAAFISSSPFRTSASLQPAYDSAVPSEANSAGSPRPDEPFQFFLRRGGVFSTGRHSPVLRSSLLPLLSVLRMLDQLYSSGARACTAEVLWGPPPGGSNPGGGGPVGGGE